jgi:hypothetical protein
MFSRSLFHHRQFTIARLIVACALFIVAQAVAKSAATRSIRNPQSAMVPAEPTTQTVILRNISWPLYRQLLARKGDSGNPRFAYNRGTLEITMPSFEHEQINQALARLGEAIAEELELDYVNAGSTTFGRQELGFEPDTCFYLKHVGPAPYC